MVDGFWIVRTKVPEGTGGCVVFLHGGKLYGGDNAFAFAGIYLADEKSMKARLTVQNFDANVQSIFGVKGDYELDVSVTVQGEDKMVGTAMLANQPQKSIGLEMLRKAKF